MKSRACRPVPLRRNKQYTKQDGGTGTPGPADLAVQTSTLNTAQVALKISLGDLTEAHHVATYGPPRLSFGSQPRHELCRKTTGKRMPLWASVRYEVAS